MGFLIKKFRSMRLVGIACYCLVAIWLVGCGHSHPWVRYRELSRTWPCDDYPFSLAGSQQAYSFIDLGGSPSRTFANWVSEYYDEGSGTKPLGLFGESQFHVMAAIGCSGLCPGFDGYINLDDDLDKNGRNPLHYAGWFGRDFRTVPDLVTLGANIDKEDAFGHTPFDYAIIRGNDATAREMLRRGANFKHHVVTGNGDGLTPLHMAVVSHNESLIKVLLKWGADINAPSSNNETPLLLLAKEAPKGDAAISVARLLIEAGADPLIQPFDPLQAEKGWRKQYPQGALRVYEIAQVRNAPKLAEYLEKEYWLAFEDLLDKAAIKRLRRKADKED